MHKTLNICTINAIYWVGYIIEGAASVKWTPPAVVCAPLCLFLRSCVEAFLLASWQKQRETVISDLPSLSLSPPSLWHQSKLQSLDGHLIRPQGLCIFAFSSKDDRNAWVEITV